MLLELKHEYTYGPVPSRRLGRSLGVNALPKGRKVCSFNCAYCQYGFAQAMTLEQAAVAGFPAVQEVLAAVEQKLDRLALPPDFLTFSGNGEPTLHPEFSLLAEELVALRDRRCPSARTAILSNASTVHRDSVRAGLRLLDDRIMKLDAATPALLEGYNGPHAGLDLEEIIDGLASLGGVTLQALFTAGPRGNLGPTPLEAWFQAVQRVSPAAVQVYTLSRPFPEPDIAPASRESLEAIVATLVKRGIQARAY